jgi:hypothetical protein
VSPNWIYPAFFVLSISHKQVFPKQHTKIRGTIRIFRGDAGLRIPKNWRWRDVVDDLANRAARARS